MGAACNGNTLHDLSDARKIPAIMLALPFSSDLCNHGLSKRSKLRVYKTTYNFTRGFKWLQNTLLNLRKEFMR